MNSAVADGPQVGESDGWPLAANLDPHPAINPVCRAMITSRAAIASWQDLEIGSHGVVLGKACGGQTAVESARDEH